MLQKCLEGVSQNLIRAVAGEHLLGRHTVPCRDRLAQTGCARIGVEVQTVRCGGDRGQDARRGSVRVLVGIELDDAIQLWLLTGHVWRQAMDD